MEEKNKQNFVVDVIIPAFNEENSIGNVVKDIPAKLVRNIIVCDNNSTDNTAKVATEAGAVVVPAPRQGYGSACLAGMDYIRNMSENNHPDIIVFMDADHSDYGEEMPMLISPLVYDNYDMVIGSRALGVAEKGAMSPQQIFGNWLATTLIKMIYGFEFSDLGPYRALKWDSLESLNMKDPDYGWTVEMQVKAVKQKLKCKEIPVNYRKRIGVSKISGTIKGTLKAGHKILWTIFKLL